MSAYVARQPVFDRNCEVFSYALAMRDAPAGMFLPPDPTQTNPRARVDEALMAQFQALCAGKRAIIPVAMESLLKDYATALPREWIAIALPTPDEAAPDITGACRKLKAAGFLLVLPDHAAARDELRALCDILIVDYRVGTGPTPSPQAPASTGARRLARCVDTRDAFHDALNAGYDYFQGRFFCRPFVLASQGIPQNKTNCLQMLQVLQRPDVDFQQLESVVKQDVSLSYKLLRYINSAYFGVGTRVKSIMHAMTLLGLRDFRRWSTLIALANVSGEKPNELLLQSLIRAKFCELLAPGAGMANRAQSLYFLGMFSLLDTILDRPMDEALANLPLEDEIKAALHGAENPSRRILDYVLAYETGDWDRVGRKGAGAAAEADPAPDLYVEAVQYAERSFKSAQEAI